MSKQAVGASFRDPSGFIFEHDGLVYRQVNQRYAEDYGQLMSSGLFDALVSKKLIVEHAEVDAPVPPSPEHYRTLLPDQIPFISYPYEWCFSQLKDAAHATSRNALA
jgi:hypothetical protein